MKDVIIIVIVLLAFFYFETQELVSSNVRVNDGDTITIENRRTRLFGIDALELDQKCKRNKVDWSCGGESKNKLIEFLKGKEISCKTVDVDRLERDVSVCYAGEQDINEWLVRNGWAMAYRAYSYNYVKAENQAKNEKLGIWSSEFRDPKKFRDENRY